MTVIEPDQPPPIAQEDLLRATFVEMLFALAASDVAVHTAEVVQAKGEIIDKLPALTHLTLGLLLIAVSWVGWRQSASPGMKTFVTNVISMPFLGLLVDVGIVIIYFVLIRQVEVKMKDDEPLLTTVSALPEATWMLVVFGVYMFWDLMTDVFSPREALVSTRGLSKLNAFWRASIVSIFASLVVLILCLIVRGIATEANNELAVILLDVALISAVLLFRLLKLVENALAEGLNVDDLPAFSKKREVHKHHRVVGYVMGIVYFLAVVGSCWSAEPPASSEAAVPASDAFRVDEVAGSP